MITYKSKKNPSILITSDGEVDPKFKTVFVTYPDGKTRTVSIATLHNQWDVVDTQATINNKKITPLF